MIEPQPDLTAPADAQTDSARTIPFRLDDPGADADPAARYLIRRAAPTDEAVLVTLLEQYVTRDGASPRHDWLYRRNPQGPAVTWLALDRVTGEIAGFTSIMPRDFVVAARLRHGSVGFDAYVMPAHRRRGIARALHRASLRAMQEGDVPFGFMCGPPVRENLSALVQVGARVIGTLRYLSLPLNARGLVEPFRSHPLLGGVAWLADHAPLFDALVGQALGAARLGLATGGVPTPSSRALTARRVERLDGRFDRLFEDVAARVDVIGRRDVPVLTWRYLENPVCRQEIIAVERGGKLVGWGVVELAARGALLVDHLLPLDPDEARATVAAIVAYLAGRGAGRIVLRANLRGPTAGAFLRLGFVPGRTREEWQVLGGDTLLPLLRDPSGWHLTGGDLNPEASPWSVCTTPREGA
jgi:GNAT superfamily N-acetyltransferase